MAFPATNKASTPRCKSTSSPTVRQESPYIQVPSNSAFYNVRGAVSQGNFRQMENSPWPIAQINKGRAVGQAQLLPPGFEPNEPIQIEVQNDLVEQMFRDAAKLSDSDADILDILHAQWLAQARRPSDSAMIRLDDLLTMRNLKRKRGAGGRASGYRPSQRASVRDSLQRLENIWITMARLEVYRRREGLRRAMRYPISAQSRAFIVTDRVVRERGNGGPDLISFRFRPGDIFSEFLFGPGRQVALLSAKVVEYHPCRRRWEKRLARYFSWLWRIRANSGTYLQALRVSTLLSEVENEITRLTPSSIRNRLEKALETLEADGIIKAWQYECWDDSAIKNAGWFEVWRNTKVIVEPPTFIVTKYLTIGAPHKPPKATSRRPNTDLRDQFLRVRLNLGISQMYAAQQVGVSANLLCMVEKGTRLPSRTVSHKIEEWLKHPNSPVGTRDRIGEHNPGESCPSALNNFTTT